MPRVKPPLDYMKLLVAYADRFGDHNAARKYEITVRTIQNYRRDIQDAQAPVEAAYREQVKKAHQRYLAAAARKVLLHLEDVTLKSDDLRQVMKAFQGIVDYDLAYRGIYGL